MNDYAGVVADGSENSLNSQLEQFERDTSNQVVVAVFQQLPAGANLESFCLETFNAWKIGQADKNNGVLLAIFVKDRRLRIQVGIGLEKALSDSTCLQIIDQEITSKFKQGDMTGGIVAGAQAIMRATRGEYSGTGQTVQQSSSPPPLPSAPVSYSGNSSHRYSPGSGFGWAPLLLVIFVVIISAIFGDRDTGFSSGGYHSHRRGWLGSSNRSWGSSRSSSWSRSSRSSGLFRGGGGSSRRSGGFSGGGGSSRGGGASGSW